MVFAYFAINPEKQTISFIGEMLEDVGIGMYFEIVIHTICRYILELGLSRYSRNNAKGKCAIFV